MTQEQIDRSLDEVEKLLDQEEYTKARKILSDFYIENLNTIEDKLRGITLLGNTLFLLGHLGEARQKLEEAENLLEKVSNPKNHLMLFYLISRVCGCQGKIEEGLKYANLSLEFCPQVNDKLLEALIYEAFGFCYTELGNFERSIEYSKRALLLKEHLGNQKSLATPLRQIGFAYLQLGNYSSALEYLNKGLIIVESVGSISGQATILNTIGITYLHLSDYGKALDYVSRALKMNKLLDIKYNICACLNTIGTIHYHLYDFERALAYVNESLSLSEQIGAKSSIIRSLTLLGHLHVEIGNIDQSEIYFLKAVNLSEELSNLRDLSHAMTGLAKIYISRGQFQKAKNVLTDLINDPEALKIAQLAHINNMLLLGSVQIELSESRDKGIITLKEVMNLEAEIGSKINALSASLYLSKAYEIEGDKENSLLHLKKYIELDIEIYSDDLTKQIQNENIRLAIAEKEHERQLEKLRNDKLEAELANNALLLASQSELLGNFRNDLRQIVRDITEPIDALKKIKEKLKALPCEQIDWMKFEAHFISVHPEFKTKLLEKFPDLTPQETRICLLLRVGMKSYEIGRIICVSERGIENHRFNIRKKLGLKTEQQLPEFLQNNI
jgi:tetratricopeptide (TPR) repeat protein/DNA-binding CsgD family transcriptional regulator